MANVIGKRDLEEAAQHAAGNWAQFDCFVWHRRDEIPDADKCAIIYTHHRDSGLLDQSNASAIEKAPEPFADGDGPDVVIESHSHFAGGHVDGFSIRVFRDGKITGAFRRYHKLAEALADYPILDEEDYSRREYEATIENIADSAWRLKDAYEVPDDWKCEVYSWLSDHRCHAIENVDDQGGYPDEADLKTAFGALGFPQLEAAV